MEKRGIDKKKTSRSGTSWDRSVPDLLIGEKRYGMERNTPELNFPGVLIISTPCSVILTVVPFVRSHCSPRSISCVSTLMTQFQRGLFKKRATQFVSDVRMTLISVAS